MAGGEHAASGSPGTSASVGFATSALAVGEHTILSTPGYDFTENASGVFRHGTDGWETVVVSNINAGGGTRHDYGCYRDAYALRCDYNFNWYAMGLDPSVAIDWNGTNDFYVMTMTPDRLGVQIKRSTNPCPAGCAGTGWDACVWNDLPGVDRIDFPQILDHPGSEDMWMVANTDADGRLLVGRIEYQGCANLTYWTLNCPNLARDHMIRQRATMVGYEIWITYLNWSQNQYEFLKFNTATQSFDCNSHRPIAPFWDFTSSCACYEGLEGATDPCLGGDYYAAIGVSSPTDPYASAVVAVPVRGSGSCSSDYELRIYWSADQGNGWSWRIVTGCQNSVHPSVAYAQTPEGGSTADVVHVMSMHEYPNGSSPYGLRPVRWRSTDDGQTWGGVYIGTPQYNFPDIPGAPGADCYWGDYDALSADMANDTMYYSWGNGDVAADWVIRGQGVNP